MAKRRLTALQKRQQKEKARSPKKLTRAEIKRQQRSAKQEREREYRRSQQRAQNENLNRKKAAVKARDELHRKIARANGRLLRLERAGIYNTVYTITTNTLGAARFALGRAATEQERKRIELMVDVFLSDETSTVRGALKDIERKRKQFGDTLNHYIGDISPDVIERTYYSFGDIDVKSLVNDYLYEEIVAVFNDLEDMGIKPTTSNLARGIDNGVDTVIVEELEALGVGGDDFIPDWDDLITTAKKSGFSQALKEYKREVKEVKKL